MLVVGRALFDGSVEVDGDFECGSLRSRDGLVRVNGNLTVHEDVDVERARAFAVEIQKRIYERNQGVPRTDRLLVRIGIHIGDVERKGSDILGDAVNIGSRVCAFADPGGICVSRQVFDQVWNKLRNHLNEIGKREAKNLESPIEVFSIDLPWNTDLAEKDH